MVDNAEQDKPAVFLGSCPNCGNKIVIDPRWTIDPMREKLTWFKTNEWNLLKFIRSLPEFSETAVMIIKHEGQLRIEVERIKDKIVL